MLIITGIMTGLVIFSLGSDDNADPDKQLRRLAGLMEHWCQRAVLEGRSMGIRITRSGYDFWIPDSLGENVLTSSNSEQDLWQAVSTEPAFTAHKWADSLQPRLLLQGQLTPLDTEQPQVICFASSEITPFVMSLDSAGDAPVSLVGKLSGRLQLVGRDG